MSSESKPSKTIVTWNLPNKAERQGSKYDQGDNKDDKQICYCLSVLSKAPGGLKDSKVRNNGKWERVKEREGSDKGIGIVSGGSHKKPPVLRDYGRSKSRPAQVGWIS
jgi:hypothetical protein